MATTVEIDDDIYAFICANARGLGQTVSTVLRRFLPLGAPITAEEDAPGIEATSLASGSPLARFVAGLARYASVTDRYLQILGFVCKEDPVKFERVFDILGSRRKYFARSREEIEESGKVTQPRSIPGSSFWAMTCTDTSRKRELIGRVLETLGYPAEDIRTVHRSLV